jgi:AcrB/AcrD/AcrF family
MRARPIVMTTVAMITGMAPIAFGIGADASFRQPMAIAVIGGLLTSTLLSLLVVPVIFELVDDLEQRVRATAHDVAGMPFAHWPFAFSWPPACDALERLPGSLDIGFDLQLPDDRWVAFLTQRRKASSRVARASVSETSG